MAAQNWKGKRVVIIGAARQGLALARYLARNGAQVMLNDRRKSEELQSEMAELAKFDIQWVLGDHPLTVLDNTPEIVCVSAGVPLDNPIMAAAQKNGIRLSNDTQIFMEAVKCKTIGITGSAGKTTTTTLVGRIAQSSTAGKYGRGWVGGKIRGPLVQFREQEEATPPGLLLNSWLPIGVVASLPHAAAGPRNMPQPPHP